MMKMMRDFFQDSTGHYSMMRLVIFISVITALMGGMTHLMSDTLVWTILGIAIGGKGLQKFGEKKNETKSQ